MADIERMPVPTDLPPEEPGPFAPCVLLLDTSQSMREAPDGSHPIEELNTAVELFAEEIQADHLACHRADVSVIEIKDTAAQRVPFTLARDFTPPQLTPSGLTGIGDGIRLGLEAIRLRRQEYRNNGAQAYKPMMFLLTDGLPTDEWESAAAEVRRLCEEGRLNFFAVGTATADFDVLARIAPPTTPPMRLKPGAFHEMFRWISDSLSSVSGSALNSKVTLPPTNGWGEVAI